MQKLDYRITKTWFNLGRKNVRFWESISLRGLYVFLILSVLTLALCQEFGLRVATLPFVSMALGFILTLLIRTVIHRKRPNFEGSTYRAWLNSYSFPSAHASVAFGFSVGLSIQLFYVLPVWAAVIVAMLINLWAVLISISRLAVGVHYASDVFVGTLLGVFVTFLIFFI